MLQHTLKIIKFPFFCVVNEADFYKRIGANITRLRKKMGMTIQALAEAANMEKSNLIPMEKGRENMKASTIVRIANALGVDPKELCQ